MEVDVINENLVQNSLSIIADSNDLVLHPYLLYLNQQIIDGRKTKTLELNKTLPDLQVGYWNLSITGPGDYGTGPYFLTPGNRLTGLLLGINIPLWYYPQTAKIKAADINTKVAQSNYNYNKTVFEGQFKESYTLYLKYQSSINFYKKSALIKSQVIIEQALKSYETKEISYVDYLTVVSNALDIESNYVNVIFQNNLAVLKITPVLDDSSRHR